MLNSNPERRATLASFPDDHFDRCGNSVVAIAERYSSVKVRTDGFHMIAAIATNAEKVNRGDLGRVVDQVNR